MGASASALSNITQQQVSKSDLPPELSSVLVDFKGTKTIEEIIKEVENSYDVFLTHNWGPGPEHANHKLISRINDALKKKKIRTWFDSQRLTGDVVGQITRGIDNSRIVVAFLTREYIDKVRQADNPNDYCKLEFKYSSSRKTADNMLAIVVEPGVRDTSTWDGDVGFFLGSYIYYDISAWNDLNFDTLLDGLHSQIL